MELPCSDIKFSPAVKFAKEPPPPQAILGWDVQHVQQQKKARIWGETYDAYKLVVNPYWLVNPTHGELEALRKTTGIRAPVLSKKRVISRAYHKMLEMLHEFKLIDRSSDKSRSVAAIAEAPGGFAQAVEEYGGFKAGVDRIIGISILSEDVKVPKFAENVARVFTATYGKGSGDICRQENIDEFAKNFEGKNAACLATADGGFEVHNWQEKEARVAHLAWSELNAAIRTLKSGGNFVCKFYNMYSTPTLQILYFASGLFTHMYVCKPDTSRITNTEHYMVCLGFRGLTSEQAKLLKQIKEKLTEGDPYCGAAQDSPYVQSFIETQVPSTFIKALRAFNVHMEALRENVSEAAYNLIVETIHGSKERVQKVLAENTKVAESWLKKYGVS